MYFCRLASLDLLAASLFFWRFITYDWSYDCCPFICGFLLGTDRLIFSKFFGGPRLSRYRLRNDTKSDCLYMAAISSGSTSGLSNIFATRLWRSTGVVDSGDWQSERPPPLLLSSPPLRSLAPFLSSISSKYGYLEHGIHKWCVVR